MKGLIKNENKLKVTKLMFYLKKNGISLIISILIDFLFTLHSLKFTTSYVCVRKCACVFVCIHHYG
jgi:hypothetical protein